MSFAAAIALLLFAEQDAATSGPATEDSLQIRASNRELLAMATRALEAQREDLAIMILEALLQDRERQIRSEARFRLAMLAVRRKAWADAGRYLRAILDEEPGVQRVRVELARVQAELGELDAARRTLREVQAGELPPEVARIVERFSAALRERRPFGANFQLTIAPDSNINRATRSDTLGTVIGDFGLGDDARETSGIGLAVKSEAFYRARLSEKVALLTQVGISGNFYRSGRFNDMVAIASTGPEFPLKGGQANFSAGVQRRWFGGDLYTDAVTANLDWQRAAGPRAQVRAALGYARTNNRLNNLQNSDDLSGSVSYERAFSPRSGASLTLGSTRQIARDPAYSLASVQLSGTVWREFGSTTLFASASYQHLEADRRLAIYPKRRKDDFARLSLGMTNRKIQWKGFSPQIRIGYEQNRSPIEIYRFDRWYGEFGVVRTF